MSTSVTIRTARPADAAAILRIYAPVVEETAISFELEPPGVDEMTRRVARTLEVHPWLVCAGDAGAVHGYAYATSFRGRAAYRWSTEVSVYVAPADWGRGLGRALYGELFRILSEQGFVSAFAGIALPNPASVRLHQSLGFEPVGVYRRVGYKLARWHDVGWWQRDLASPTDPPTEPVPFSEVTVEPVEIQLPSASSGGPS